MQHNNNSLNSSHLHPQIQGRGNFPLIENKNNLNNNNIKYINPGVIYNHNMNNQISQAQSLKNSYLIGNPLNSSNYSKEQLIKEKESIRKIELRNKLERLESENFRLNSVVNEKNKMLIFWKESFFERENIVNNFRGKSFDIKKIEEDNLKLNEILIEKSQKVSELERMVLFII